jgi:hypothetical protein
VDVAVLKEGIFDVQATWACLGTAV